MLHFLDRELKGHALVFDGPMDVVREAKRANSGYKPFHKATAFSWPGRKSRGNWDDMLRFIHEPWPEARHMVERVVDKIKHTELPVPKSVKRKARWSEDDGDLDVDRVLRGEPDYLRHTKRELTVGPHQIALVGNLDLTQDSRCNASGVFFRSACCIAVADVLEELGYTTEIWTWCRGIDVYPKPYHKQFMACCPKRAGDPIDYDALNDTMSAWFTTQAMFGAMAAGPVPPVDIGSAVECKYDATDLANCGIGQWAKYLDIEQGVTAIQVPMIRSRSIGSGLDTAAEVAVEVMKRVVESQS